MKTLEDLLESDGWTERWIHIAAVREGTYRAELLERKPGMDPRTLNVGAGHSPSEALTVLDYQVRTNR